MFIFYNTYFLLLIIFVVLFFCVHKLVIKFCELSCVFDEISKFSQDLGEHLVFA